MLPFDGQIAVVTGAGRGLGRSHALGLARLGASVVVNDIGGVDTEGGPWADGVVAEIEAAGSAAVASYDSVATQDGGGAVVATALERFGTVDVVVNNAGFARNRSFGEMTIEEFDDVLDVHLRGAFFVTQPAWRVMEAKGYGRILMTSSGSGVFGRPAGANYCSAKAGLVGLTKALACEGPSKGILTNCLLPFAATEFVVDSPLPGPDGDRLRDAFAMVDGRTEAERVTALALYLASPACAVNGEVYSVCLGRYARGFFGLTEGWVSPGEAIPEPETVSAHLASISEMRGITDPVSVFAEIETAAVEVARRLAAGSPGRSGR